MLQVGESLQSAVQPPAPADSADPVARLMAAIGAACDGPAAAMGQRITHALRTAAAVPDLVPAALRAPCANAYARHVIDADPAGRFTLLSIVWGPGQFSPPHAHHTWCAYAVCEHPLTETLYRYDEPSGQAITVTSTVRAGGFACFAPGGLEQIHRLGNAGHVPAISIHVYGVDRSRVGTHVNRLMDVAERER